MVFGDKNSDLCCDDKKKKKIFYDRKIRYVFVVKKEWKRFFLRREFHSQYEFMQSWIKTDINIVVYDLFLYFNNLRVLKNQVCILRKIQISFDLRKI